MRDQCAVICVDGPWTTRYTRHLKILNFYEKLMKVHYYNFLWSAVMSNSVDTYTFFVHLY